MKFSHSIALALVLGIAGVASAQKVTLRYQPPVGKSYVYGMTMSSGSNSPMMAAASMKMTGTSTMKIVSRKGDVTTVKNAMSNVNFVVPKGSPLESQVAAMKKQATTEITMGINSLGGVANMSAAGGNPQANQMMNSMMGGSSPFAVLPKNPVGVGSTWTSSFDIGKMIGNAMPGMKVDGGKVLLTSKLVKFISQGGKKLAQIHISGTGTTAMNLPGGQGGSMKMTMKMSINTDTTIDVATGITVSMTSTTTNAMQFGGQGSMTQDTKMSMTLKG